MDQNFKDLCQTVIDRQNGQRTLFMSFSNGKDSLAAFLRVHETGMFDEYVLYYYYLIPDLSWIEDYLNYFEKRFKVKIIRVPNPTLYRLLQSGVLQTPTRLLGFDKFHRDGGQFVQFDAKVLMETVRFNYGLPDNIYCALGVKAADSPIRRHSIKTYGAVNDNQMKWYPIHDFSDRDIVNILQKHDLPLPEDYDLFGLTFDGLDYRFLKVVKDRKPKDYQKIKNIFPLIDLVIHRREHYWGTHRKTARFQKYVKELKILK